MNNNEKNSGQKFTSWLRFAPMIAGLIINAIQAIQKYVLEKRLEKAKVRNDEKAIQKAYKDLQDIAGDTNSERFNNSINKLHEYAKQNENSPARPD